MSRQLVLPRGPAELNIIYEALYEKPTLKKKINFSLGIFFCISPLITDTQTNVQTDRQMNATKCIISRSINMPNRFPHIPDFAWIYDKLPLKRMLSDVSSVLTKAPQTLSCDGPYVTFSYI